MSRNIRSTLTILVLILFVSLACSISVPGTGAINNVGTSVAETVNALSGTAADVLTAMPHDLDLTPSPEDDLPTIAPDEMEFPLRVSFVTPDGSLYTWLDGMASPILLVAEENICCSYISPDGALIAFSRYSGYDFSSLEVINADGTNRRTLLTAAKANLLPKPDDAIATEPDRIAWVPGTHSLSMSMRHSFEGPGLFRSESFYIADAEGAGFYSLLETGSTTWQFVWSPDGSKVAISNPNGIDIYNSAGAKIAGPVVTYPFINTASEYAWSAYPLWSENGASLIVRIPPQDPFFSTGSDANSSVWQVQSDAWLAEQVLSTPMLYNMSGETDVSPDLSKIIYLLQTGLPADNTYNLVGSNLDGSDPITYATGRFQGPLEWSPDSSHFYYSLGEMPSSQPYIGQVGSSPTAVMDFTNPMAAKWIDSNRYIVSTNDDGRQRLLLGTVGTATGLIYDTLAADASQLITFSVNR